MIIGLDIGTQSLKAVVANEGLEVLGGGSVSYEPSFPCPGAAEQDADVWEQALAPAIRRALDAAGCVARNSDTIEPDADAFDAYQEGYLRYRALFEALRPVFNGGHS